MARRRRWAGASAAARTQGLPDVVATMWILLVLFGALGGVLCYPPWGAAPVPPEPVQVMTDVTNHLGVALLKDYACLPGNVAFSPYGAASVLIVLWEGAKGESGVQLRKALGLPSSSHTTLDYGVIRLGMRDIHRHLRSYFAHDGYLNGLTFGNTTAANIKPSFREILRFYGYDPDTAMSGGGEVVTPPWMKHMTTTTPFSEIMSTTPVTNMTESTVESKTENDTLPNTTQTIPPNTLSSPLTTTVVDALPLVPSPTSSMSTTATPAKTTKGSQITTQKTTSASTTETMQSDSTVKPVSVTLSDDLTSTPPTTKSLSSATSTSSSATAPSSQNTSTTLKDFKDPSMPTLTDITDYTSSTRVTRRMPPSSETATESETNAQSVPTAITTNSSEAATTLDFKASTTENFEPAIPSDHVTSFTPSVLSTESQEAPSLSSMLTTMSGGKTSDSGVTTTFILMTMTTQKFHQANLTTMLPQSLNLVTNEQIVLQNTTPLPVESSTDQPTTTESASDTTTADYLTTTTESFQSTFFSTSTPTTIDKTDITETSAQITTETTLIEETTKTENSEDFTYSTTPEYKSTTNLSDDMVENLTTSNVMDLTLTTPTTPPDVLTTTETSEGTNEVTSESTSEGTSEGTSDGTSEGTTTATETTTMIEATSTPDYDEISSEETDSKTRKKRSAEGENNFFPEIQLHLHGNAMLSADDKDMDTMWQNYQEKFGLPLGPFHVHHQGREPTVKWVPMIRMVKHLLFAYISRLQAQALMLPLDDERYKLLLILPVGDNSDYEGWRPTRQKRSYPFQLSEPRDQSLLRLIDDLHSVPLREIVSSVQPCLVAATIPPFLIRGLLDLTPSLARMGVRDVFDPKTADLSGMSNSTNLWVRGVEQTVSVAIDINGIFGRNSAAYSSNQEDHSSFRSQQEWSHRQTHPINHPHKRRDASSREGYWGGLEGERRVERHFMATRSFLFFVVDTSTRVALMAGKVVDPTSTKNS